MVQTINSSGLFDFVYDYYKSVKNHKIMLAYEGELNQDIIKAFSRKTEDNLKKTGESKDMQNKACKVLDLCLQLISANKILAGSETNDYLKSGVFLISGNQQIYNFTAGCLTDKENNNFLTDQLELLNSLSFKQLEELSKQKIIKEQSQDRMHLVSGLAEIIRNSKKKLEFSFLPFSDSKSFFLFTATILRKK